VLPARGAEDFSLKIAGRSARHSGGWFVKVETDGKTTRLSSNAISIQIARAAAAGWGAISGPAGIYLVLTSGWVLSDRLLLGLVFALQAPLSIMLALRIAHTSAIVDQRNREIRLMRKSLLTERSETVTFADIAAVEQPDADNGSFVSLKLRSGATVVLTPTSIPIDSADAVVATIRAAIADYE